MKRSIAVIMLLAMVFCFAGCKDDPVDTTSSGVTYYDGTSTTEITKDYIEEQVKAGTLEVEYEGSGHDEFATGRIALKMTSDQLAEELSQGELLREVGENYIRYSNGGMFLYYTNDDRANGLASIVYPGTVYGFEPTITTVSQVKSVMGEPATEGPAPDKAIRMFLFGVTDTTMLDYDCGDHRITFFFVDGRYSMVALYQEGLWIY